MGHVILLHGALGCKSHWDHVLPHLDTNHTYHNLNFPLHGKTASMKKGLTLADLSGFVSAYATEQQLGNYAIVGYSMGGYVGLDLAIRHERGLKQLVTLGTKLNWSEHIAEEEIAKLSIDNLALIHEKLEQEHGNAWQDVVFATHAIMRSIGQNPLNKEDFGKMQVPVCLLLGEKDKMVTQDETMAFAGSGGSCSYEVMPATPHLLERVDGPMIAAKINKLLTGEQAV